MVKVGGLFCWYFDVYTVYVSREFLIDVGLKFLLYVVFILCGEELWIIVKIVVIGDDEWVNVV